MNEAVSSYDELLRYLDENDEQSAARRYVLLRAKLTMYFEGRKISPAEDFADEVLHRVATKISTGEKIDDINRYVFGVARFVCLEHYRRPEMETIETESRDGSLRTPPALTVQPKVYLENEEDSDIRHKCLRSCLAELSDEKRRLLVDYYAVDETNGKHKNQRKQLALLSNRTAGALQKEISLLRKKIGNCTKECVKENE